jgi:hypothetical protein
MNAIKQLTTLKKALYQALETVQDGKDHIGFLLFIYLFFSFFTILVRSFGHLTHERYLYLFRHLVGFLWTSDQPVAKPSLPYVSFITKPLNSEHGYITHIDR